MEQIETIQNHIYVIRGRRVMLDYDLARIYQVETKVLNQAVKRNPKRFEGEEFMFQLTKAEWRSIIAQTLVALPNPMVDQAVAVLKRDFERLL